MWVTSAAMKSLRTHQRGVHACLRLGRRARRRVLPSCRRRSSLLAGGHLFGRGRALARPVARAGGLRRCAGIRARSFK